MVDKLGMGMKHDTDGGRRTYSEETRLTATSFTISPTSTGLKSSPGLWC